MLDFEIAVSDLHERRNKLFEENKTLLDKATKERRTLSTEEQKLFDQRDSQVEQLRQDISRYESTANTDRQMSQSRGRQTESVIKDGPDSNTDPLAAWVDVEGREVRCYKPNERIGTERPNVSVGALMRAMICGPRNEAERRALAEGADSTGGITVPDITGRWFIDGLRAATSVIKAGAQTVPLTSDTTKIARLVSDPVAAWRSENAAIAESDPAFDGVTFTARSLAVFFKTSRELLEDSLNIEQMVTQSLTEAMAVKLDLAALAGSGTPPEPRGIRNTTNVNSVSMGTNGLALANFDPLVNAVYENLLDNATPPNGMIMHPRSLTNIAKLKDTTNQALVPPAIIASLPSYSTTSVSITDTQGSSSVASRIYIGDFRQLYVGIRSNLRIEVLRERFAENHQYAFVAHLRADVAVSHPEAFCQVIGVL